MLRSLIWRAGTLSARQFSEPKGGFMEILPEFPDYKSMPTLKKSVSGGFVVSLSFWLMSFFHGLSPEQSQAGVVVSTAVLEGLRNLLKKKFPRFFSWF